MEISDEVIVVIDQLTCSELKNLDIAYKRYTEHHRRQGQRMIVVHNYNKVKIYEDLLRAWEGDNQCFMNVNCETSMAYGIDDPVTFWESDRFQHFLLACEVHGHFHLQNS